MTSKHFSAVAGSAMLCLMLNVLVKEVLRFVPAILTQPQDAMLFVSLSSANQTIDSGSFARVVNHEMLVTLSNYRTSLDQQVLVVAEDSLINVRVSGLFKK